MDFSIIYIIKAKGNWKLRMSCKHKQRVICSNKRSLILIHITVIGYAIMIKKLNIKQTAENANQEGGNFTGLKQNTLLHRSNNALKSPFCVMALLLLHKFKVLNLRCQENCNVLKIWWSCSSSSHLKDGEQFLIFCSINCKFYYFYYPLKENDSNT